MYVALRMHVFTHVSVRFNPLMETLAGYFLCSAVDQFKKQFSHLEESGGNSPSVPTDRKHASLPR